MNFVPHPVAHQLIKTDQADAAPFFGCPASDFNRDQRLARTSCARNHDTIIQSSKLKNGLLLISEKPFDVPRSSLDLLARIRSPLLNRQTDGNEGLNIAGRHGPGEPVKAAVRIDAATYPCPHVGTEIRASRERLKHPAI